MSYFPLFGEKNFAPNVLIIILVSIIERGKCKKQLMLIHVDKRLIINLQIAQLAEAIEYTDCISVEW